MKLYCRENLKYHSLYDILLEVRFEVQLNIHVCMGCYLELVSNLALDNSYYSLADSLVRWWTDIN
jgi:hypothetical protein